MRRNGMMFGIALLLISVISGMLAYGIQCDRPDVRVKDGQLSVQSNGCSLMQLLKAIQESAGIQMDIPPSTAQIPVVIDVGPATPSSVIDTLLEGSDYNYVLMRGESNTLARVVITEVNVAALKAYKPPAAPGKVLDSPKQTASSRQQKAAGEVSKKVEDSDQPTFNSDETEIAIKRELDKSTLDKLPPLPAGIPSAMWNLYPELVANGGTAPDVPLTLTGGKPLAQQATAAQPGTATQSMYPQDPPAVPKGVVGLPTLPPGIDPNMGRIYPWNLMQTITGPIIYPSFKLPPMAPPIGVTPSTHP